MFTDDLINSKKVTLTVEALKVNNDEDTLFEKDMPLDDYIFIPSIGRSCNGSA